MNGQRPKNQGVDEAENGAVRANTQSQRQYRDSREARALPQQAQGVPQVLSQPVQPPPSPGLAARLRKQLSVEMSEFQRVVTAIARVIQPAEE